MFTALAVLGLQLKSERLIVRADRKFNRKVKAEEREVWMSLKKLYAMMLWQTISMLWIWEDISTWLLQFDAAFDSSSPIWGMNGVVQGRWCYPIERCLKTIRKKCRNKCKIEASIAEAYILEEVSNFTTTYYGDKLPSVHNPPPRYNDGDNESNLSIFRGQLGSASGSTTKTLTHMMKSSSKKMG